MMLEAVAGGERFQIEQIDEKTFRVGATTRQVDLRVLEPGVYSLIIEGRSFEVAVRGEKGNFVVEVGGHLIPVHFIDPSHKEVEAGGLGPSLITSPMPGRIVAIKVKEGEEVAAGAGVIVVEAMKMENELSAPSGGRVKRIAVKVGDAVEAGQELVQIE